MDLTGYLIYREYGGQKSTKVGGADEQGHVTWNSQERCYSRCSTWPNQRQTTVEASIDDSITVVSSAAHTDVHMAIDWLDRSMEGGVNIFDEPFLGFFDVYNLNGVARSADLHSVFQYTVN